MTRPVVPTNRRAGHARESPEGRSDPRRGPAGAGAPERERARPARSRAQPATTLAGYLDAYLARDGRSLNQIAQAALIDVAYLWRLRMGQKRHPSRDVLIRLGLALRLEPEELDEVLVAADHAPITLRQL